MASRFTAITFPNATTAAPANLAARVSSGRRMDFLGVLCSVGCAIHCAATPVLLSIVPSLTSVRFLADPLFHQLSALLCGFLVWRAIVPGWKIHRQSVVLDFAGAGIALLLIAAFVLPDRCGSHALVAEGPVRLVAASTNAGLEFCEENRSTMAIGQTWFSEHSLASLVGSEFAGQAIVAQPFLSPLGGLLLIIAHVLNIRLSCCKRDRCSDAA